MPECTCGVAPENSSSAPAMKVSAPTTEGTTGPMKAEARARACARRARCAPSSSAANMTVATPSGAR